MLPVKKLPLRKLLYIGRQKGNARGAAPRSCGDGQWRKKSKRWGRDLGRHQAYGKGPADVEVACFCPTCHLRVKGMSECVGYQGLGSGWSPLALRAI